MHSRRMSTSRTESSVSHGTPRTRPQGARSECRVTVAVGVSRGRLTHNTEGVYASSLRRTTTP